VTFKNNTREVVGLFWLNFQGGQQPYPKINPGQQYVQATWVGHKWIIKDPSGTCLRGLTVLPNDHVSIESDIALEIMASPVGYATGPSLGHAFMCIEHRLNSGTKEDCYGFYPLSAQDFFVGGPGLVSNEFNKNPLRFSNIAASGVWPLSNKDAQTVLNIINTFDARHNYSLTDSNCLDFVVNAARAVGLKGPARSSTQTPVAYLQSLVSLNPQ
jgi:hypothetical protein